LTTKPKDTIKEKDVPHADAPPKKDYKDFAVESLQLGQQDAQLVSSCAWELFMKVFDKKNEKFVFHKKSYVDDEIMSFNEAVGAFNQCFNAARVYKDIMEQYRYDQTVKYEGITQKKAGSIIVPNANMVKDHLPPGSLPL